MLFPEPCLNSSRGTSSCSHWYIVLFYYSLFWRKNIYRYIHMYVYIFHISCDFLQIIIIVVVVAPYFLKCQIACKHSWLLIMDWVLNWILKAWEVKSEWALVWRSNPTDGCRDKLCTWLSAGSLLWGHIGIMNVSDVCVFAMVISYRLITSFSFKFSHYPLQSLFFFSSLCFVFHSLCNLFWVEADISNGMENARTIKPIISCSAVLSEECLTLFGLALPHLHEYVSSWGYFENWCI